MIVVFAPVGRSPSSPAVLVVTIRPKRSYQGPEPTRLMAVTVDVLKNALHTLQFPGILASAIAVQILSAPVRPSLVP